MLLPPSLPPPSFLAQLHSTSFLAGIFVIRCFVTVVFCEFIFQFCPIVFGQSRFCFCLLFHFVCILSLFFRLHPMDMAMYVRHNSVYVQQCLISNEYTLSLFVLKPSKLYFILRFWIWCKNSLFNQSKCKAIAKVVYYTIITKHLDVLRFFFISVVYLLLLLICFCFYFNCHLAHWICCFFCILSKRR